MRRRISSMGPKQGERVCGICHDIYYRGTYFSDHRFTRMHNEGLKRPRPDDSIPTRLA